MKHNTIDTVEQYNTILDQIKNGDKTTWTLKMHKVYVAKTLSQIGEEWQKDIISDKLQTLSLIFETLHYMASFTICRKVEYRKYKNVLDSYLDNLLDLEADDIYERSIKSLNELGYKF